MADQDFSTNVEREESQRRQSGRIRNTISGHTTLNVDQLLPESPLEEPVFKKRRGRPAKLSDPTERNSAQKSRSPPKNEPSESRDAFQSVQERPRSRPSIKKDADTQLSSASRNNTNEKFHKDCQGFAPAVLHMATDFDEIKEVDSGENNEKVQVGSYRVSPEVADTLQAIFAKQGDIARYCELGAGDSKISAALESICCVVQEIQTTKYSNLRQKDLDAFDSVLADAEKLKLNVKWLRDRLDEIPRLEGFVKKYNQLECENERTTVVVDTLKRSLEKKKAEIQELEGKVELETSKSDKLKNEMNETMSSWKRLSDNCLKDGVFQIFM